MLSLEVGKFFQVVICIYIDGKGRKGREGKSSVSQSIVLLYVHIYPDKENSERREMEGKLQEEHVEVLQKGTVVVNKIL